ncbi:unnamed protein product [Closterium sp. Yama58-4]|nr:unnamed protein product [Closterium sp. Yama58-4]
MSPSANALILFAAQTLRSKIQLQLSALDSSARAALLSALFSLFQSFCCVSNQHQVLLQICASISALLLQSPGTAADLEARLEAATSAAEGGGGSVWGMMGGVVELLGAVGDECTDEQRWSVGVVTLQRKHVFCMEILSHSKFVAMLLQKASSLSLSALSQSQTAPGAAAEAADRSVGLSLLHKTLRCLFTWVRIGFLTDLLAADTWQSHVLPLVELAADSLQEASLCEVATEVVGEMASRHESLLPAITPRLLSSFSQAAITHPDAFPPLASPPSNASASAAAASPFASGAAGGAGGGGSSMDEEERERLVAAFASAIADVGLAHQLQPCIATFSPGHSLFPTRLLRCASVRSSDHRIAISLLPLWSGLSEFLSSCLNNPSSPSPPALSAQDAAATQAILLAALPLCLSHAKVGYDGGMARGAWEGADEAADQQPEETLVDLMRAVGAASYLTCVTIAWRCEPPSIKHVRSAFPAACAHGSPPPIPAACLQAAPVLLASPTPQPHQLLTDPSALELQLFASQAVGQVADSDRPEDVAWACQVLSAVAAVAAAVATAPQPSIPPRLQPWVHRAVAANVLAYLSFLPRVPAIVPALLQSLSRGLLPPTTQQASPAGATPAPARGGRRVSSSRGGSGRASEQATSACAAALCALCEAHNANDSAAVASASLNEGLAAQLVAVGETLHLAPLQPKQEADVITAVASAVSSLPPSHLLLALQRLLQPILATLHAFSAQQLTNKSCCEAAASFTRLTILLEHIRLPSPEVQRQDHQLPQYLQQLPPSLRSHQMQSSDPRLQQPGETHGGIQSFLLSACWPHLQFLLSLPSSSSSSSPALDRDALTSAVAAAARCLAPLATLSGDLHSQVIPRPFYHPPGPTVLPCIHPTLTSLETPACHVPPIHHLFTFLPCSNRVQLLPFPSPQHPIPPGPSILRCTDPSLTSLQSAFSAADPSPSVAHNISLSPSLPHNTPSHQAHPFSPAPTPASVALKAPKGAEQHPELTEALLHFATFLLGLVPPAHLAADPSSPVLPPLSHLLQVAPPACTAAHRGVSASSFAFISALMTAAIQQAGALSLQSQSQPQAQQGVPPLVQLCTAHGALLSHTLVAALLGPSAVSRVHKCVSLLQQLFHVCCCAARASGSSHTPASAGAEASAAAVQAALPPMHQWLVAAFSALPPGFLRAGEAEAVLPAWLTQLASSPPPLDGSSSEVEWGNTRMLRRLLRSFADSHRHTAVAIASGSRVKQLLEDEVRRDLGLSAIRLRFTANGALEHCSLFSEAGGRHSCNQDSMIAWEDFNVPEIAGRVKGRMPPGAASDVIFCAVFDGHGPNGHLVSQRVRDSLPSRIASLLAPPPVATVSPYGHLDKCAPPMAPASDQLLQRLGVNGGSSKSKGASGKVHPLGVAPAYGGDGGMTLQRSRSANSLENSAPRGSVSPYHSSSSSASSAAAAAAAAAAEASREASKAQVERAFRRAFLEMDDELRSHPHVDGHVSGSTAVVAALLGRRLVVASIGDSRAVLAYRCKAGHAVTGTAAPIGGMQCKPLTNDHKCSVATERKRIEQAGGRVQASEHEPGTPRIWLPRERSPGLVPSRAFGDFVVKDYGVIAEPDILIRHLTLEDEFIILASDGLWDVMTPQEAMSAVLAAPTRQTAARHLIAQARSIWAAKHQSEGNEEAFDDTASIASMGTVCTEASFGTVIYSETDYKLTRTEADYKPSRVAAAEETNPPVVLTPPVCEDGFYRDDTIRVPVERQVERQAEGGEKENMGNGDGGRSVLGSMGQGMSSQDSSSSSASGSVGFSNNDSKKQGVNAEGRRSILGLFYNGEVAASASAYASLGSSKVVPLPLDDHTKHAPENPPGNPTEKAPGNPPVTITICSADGTLLTAADARVMAPPMRSRSLTALSACMGGGMAGMGGTDSMAGTGGTGTACMGVSLREGLGSETSSSCAGGNGYGCTNTRAADRYVSLERGVAVEAGDGAEDEVGSKWGGKWGSAWESSGAGCGAAMQYAVARLGLDILWHKCWRTEP